MTARRRRVVRLEDLVGQKVRTAEGDVVGRIEEVRAERRGDEHEVVDYLIGPGALRQRLALFGLLFPSSRTIIARWDQLDIRRPEAPTLTCALEELEHARQ